MTTDPPSYDWQRYLCPADAIYTRTGDGFLIPPAPEQLWRQNQHLQTLASLANQPCLIILGEPGIGKSRVMRQEAARLRKQRGSNALVIEDSFADYSTRSELTTELFS